MEFPYYVNFQKSQENLFSLIEKEQSAKSYQKNQMIYLQGELADSFYYLKKGKVKIFLCSEAGSEKALTTLEKHQVFGEAAFFDGMPRVSSAKALESCEIIAINQRILLHYFKQDPNFAIGLLQYLARTVRMLSAQVDNMTFLQADKRIAQFLINLSKKEEANPVIHSTHEEIATIVGTSRITVSKILNTFVKKGWIKTEYRKIVVLDYSSLEKFAYSS